MTQQGSPSQSVERDGIVASRRAVLAGGLALAAAACAPASNTPPSNTAAPTAAGQSPGSLQEVSGHALYSLPQDHKWHTGGIFDSGQLQEWHYWTGFFTDDATGEKFGIFYNITNNPSAPGGPSLWQQGVSFSFGDFAKQELTWAHQPTAVGSLQATRPPDSTSPDDFQYNAKGENVEFTTVYRAEPNTWNFHFAGVAANNGNPPIVMDIENTTQSPYGYMPVGLGGFENQNIPWNGQNLDPTNLYSLSYYYTGPISSSKGTVTIGGKTRNLTGTIWFEHQWGNFNSGQSPWTTAYTWGALTFDNGNVFTWRQWYGAPNGSRPSNRFWKSAATRLGRPMAHRAAASPFTWGTTRSGKREDLEITGERAQHRHSGTIDQLFRDLVPHERLRQLRDTVSPAPTSSVSSSTSRTQMTSRRESAPAKTCRTQCSLTKRFAKRSRWRPIARRLPTNSTRGHRSNYRPPTSWLASLPTNRRTPASNSTSIRRTKFSMRRVGRRTATSAPRTAWKSS